MLIFLRVLRGIFGFIAIWQVLGLLPVLTNWFPNLQSTTGNMWAIAFFKFLVFTFCAAAYHWLGRIKKKYEGPEARTSELPAIGVAVGVLLLFGFGLAIFLPTLRDQPNTTDQVSSPQLAQPISDPPRKEIPPPPPGFVLDTAPSIEAQIIPPPPPGFVIDTQPSQENGPSFETKGWTQGSTGSDIFDPYQEAQVPRGTRFYRDANGMIFRVYPPGTRPELESANPFGLMESKAGPPI